MKNSDNWNKFIGSEIPSSIKTQPIIYNFIKKDYKIIDIGCGFGKTVFDLHKNGYVNVYGIDTNKSGIKLADSIIKKLQLISKPKFKTANALNLPFLDEIFDCAITQSFWTTIVMANERLKIIKEINRIVKQNGILYIADFEQNYGLPMYKKRYENGIKMGYENGTFEVINKKTKEIEYLAHHYTKKELFDLARGGGFSKIEYYESKIFTTRSGNNIKGCVIIAKKNL